MFEDIDFQRLSAIRFEELCFELFMASGFEKLVWRKGGADSGRDIQGVRTVRTDVVEPFEETWFFECKHYEAGVPPEVLHSKIAWADAERPRHFVIIVSSYLTNPAREWLEKLRLSKPYRIHVLEGKALQYAVSCNPNLVSRYFATDIQRLMQDAHRAWIFHNLVPEPGILRRLGAPDRTYEYTPNQLAFLWASLKVRLREMMKEMDDSYSESYDHLFGSLKSLATTTQSVLADEKEWAMIDEFECGSTYDVAFTKVYAAQVAHIVGKTELIALYCFVRDDEGEGLEVLVDQDSNLTYAIRHIPSGARAELIDVKKRLHSACD